MKKAYQLVSLIFTVVFLFSAIAFSEVKPLSLSEFTQLVLNNSPELKKTKITLEIKEIDYTKAKYQSHNLALKTLNEKETTLSLAKETVASTKTQVILDASEQLLSFLDAKANLLEKELLLVKSQRDLTLFEFRFEKGLISKSELESHKEQVNQNEQGKKQAEYSLKLQVMKLNHLAGLPLEDELELDIPLLPLPKLPDKDELYKVLLQGNTALKQLKSQMDEASLALELLHLQHEAALTIREKELQLEELQLDFKTKESEILFLAEQEYANLLEQLRRTESFLKEITASLSKVTEVTEQYKLGLIAQNELEEAKSQVKLTELKAQKGVFALTIALGHLGLLPESSSLDNFSLAGGPND